MIGLYKKYQRWVPLVFFLAGFLFDAYMLRRIDDWIVLVQQAAYLLAAGSLISLDLLEQSGVFAPPRWLRKPWEYREAVIHFTLGTLLNGYAIFYFKSASVVTSFVFVGLLILVLTVNEFKKFGAAQRAVHMTLLALCTLSYMIYLVPIGVGFIGVGPFLASVGASALVCSGVYASIRKRLKDKPRVRHRQVLLPFYAVHLLFVGLYFGQVIPPVPLSVSYMGIFHEVKKENGKYLLTSLGRPLGRWWQRGDQSFNARDGDKVYCFATVFSPTRFHDEVQVRWLYRDAKRRWRPADAIPFEISGGREEGYRGYTVKSNYWPGDWRVQIETRDAREIGRLDFTIAKDEGNGERPLRIEVR